MPEYGLVVLLFCPVYEVEDFDAVKKVLLVIRYRHRVLHVLDLGFNRALGVGCDLFMIGSFVADRDNRERRIRPSDKTGNVADHHLFVESIRRLSIKLLVVMSALLLV